MRDFIEVDTLAFEIRYCSTIYGVFDISKRVCANLWPYKHCDVIRVLFVFCHAVASFAQDSREINSHSYAHFNYHVMIAQWVKFSLYERCLARLMALEKKRLGGSGLFCTVHTARAVLWEDLDCSVQYIPRGLFCGRDWTVLYSKYCTGSFVGGSGLFYTVHNAWIVLW